MKQGTETLLDLYCGVGILGVLSLVQKMVTNVIAVDRSESCINVSMTATD